MTESQVEDLVNQAIRDLTERPSFETYERALHLLMNVPDTMNPALDLELANAVRWVPDHCKGLRRRRTGASGGGSVR